MTTTTADSLPSFNPAEPIAPQLFRALRTAIVTLRFEPGQALSETEIAKLFGVSRQPVREAFIKLAEAGLIEIKPQRGSFVVRISLRDVLNARFVREAVEAAVVAHAAGVAAPGFVAELEANLEEQRALAASDDWRGFLALDEAFHRCLAEGAGCAYAWRVVESIKAQMDRVRFLSFSGASPIPLLVEQHAGIVAAVKRRDPLAAEASMRRHLREILNALPQLAATHPDLFEADMPIALSPLPAGPERH